MDGLQPQHVDGCARLEQSDIGGQWDLELGKVIPKEEFSRVQEGMEIAKEIGLRPGV